MNTGIEERKGESNIEATMTYVDTPRTTSIKSFDGLNQVYGDPNML